MPRGFLSMSTLLPSLNCLAVIIMSCLASLPDHGPGSAKFGAAGQREGVGKGLVTLLQLLLSFRDLGLGSIFLQGQDSGQGGRFCNLTKMPRRQCLNEFRCLFSCSAQATEVALCPGTFRTYPRCCASL